MDRFTPLPPAEWTLERMRYVKFALADYSGIAEPDLSWNAMARIRPAK